MVNTKRLVKSVRQRTTGNRISKEQADRWSKDVRQRISASPLLLDVAFYVEEVINIDYSFLPFRLGAYNSTTDIVTLSPLLSLYCDNTIADCLLHQLCYREFYYSKVEYHDSRYQTCEDYIEDLAMYPSINHSPRNSEVMLGYVCSLAADNMREHLGLTASGDTAVLSGWLKGKALALGANHNMCQTLAKQIANYLMHSIDELYQYSAGSFGG